ncbi:MAG: glycosyltransferase family 1 protein [Burkholderiaceae bacterium]|nr:glycosyltransferase family 1 protein [Burkholderiaceae bacterium]
MRVSVVTETYPPEVNGVSLTLSRVVEGLHRRHHDVQLIRPRQGPADTPRQDPRFQEVLMRGMPIPRYPNLRMGLPSQRALVSLWRAERPDVVHIATEGPLGWSALRAALQLKLPISTDFRTNFHAYSHHYGIGWLNRPIMAYLRRFHNRTGCTMVPTDALRRELELGGFRNLSVVSRGVDTVQFAPEQRSEDLRRRWGAEPGDLVIVFVGRLAPEKNLGVLLAAFEAIRSIDARARLVLVGDGPQRAELQALCPSAIFAGHCHGQNLAAHYASADLFLFPSLTETFGNVTTEAMASGLPMVAFDHAAAAQLIRSGDNGMLANCTDAPAFIRAAVDLAADAQRRRIVGEQARRTACALAWDVIVARFEGVLSSLLQQTPAVESTVPVMLEQVTS